jgi:hypothetical protein
MTNSSTSPAANSSPSTPSSSGATSGRRTRAAKAPAPAAEVAPAAEAAMPAPAAVAQAETAEAETAEAAPRPEGSSGGLLDGLPEEARAVVELYSGALASIAFPDVDAAVLRRQAEAVAEERRAVEAARAALEAASAALQRRVEEMKSLASRGLAYARIYAAAHPEHVELAAGLSAIDSRERGGKSAAKREDGAAAPRRGRPPKQPRPELPFAAQMRGVMEAHGVSDEQMAEKAAQAQKAAQAAQAAGDDGDEADEAPAPRQPVIERD